MPSHPSYLPVRVARRSVLTIAATLGVALLATACGGSDSSGDSSDTDGSRTEPVSITLLTHDSFALSEEVVAEFEETSGIDLEIVTGGDAGELVNRAVLTAGKPEGDVLFGVDTTLLSRAVDADVFAPYESVELDALRDDVRDLGAGVVTPVDYGDVCVNVHDTWFTDKGLEPPTTLDDLTDPAYRDLLVVENAATSSPGLAFLLASVARYGDDWSSYWEDLVDNGVKVVNGWTEAYTGEFTGGSATGTRPLVVSYASSPPAEIVYASDPKPTRPSTSVMEDGCFRQVEFAGVLDGTEKEESAREVVDWLVSPAVQADVPLSMFVFPARDGVELPAVFSDFAAQPDEPLTLDVDEIAEQRDDWVEEWTSVVLR